MPKGKHHHNPKASDFTNYTVAGTDEGRAKAADLRLAYAAKRADIELQRHLRQVSIMDDPMDCSQVRRGYPKRRQRNEDIPTHRGVPHSNFLKRFKIVDRITYQLGEFHHSAKIYVLHATRGWKHYA